MEQRKWKWYMYISVLHCLPVPQVNIISCIYSSYVVDIGIYTRMSMLLSQHQVVVHCKSCLVHFKPCLIDFRYIIYICCKKFDSVMRPHSRKQYRKLYFTSNDKLVCIFISNFVEKSSYSTVMWKHNTYDIFQPSQIVKIILLLA